MIFKALHPIHSPLDYWAEGFPLSRQKAKTHENRHQHQLTESKFVTTSLQEYCIYSIECVCVCFWVICTSWQMVTTDTIKFGRNFHFQISSKFFLKTTPISDHFQEYCICSIECVWHCFRLICTSWYKTTRGCFFVPPCTFSFVYKKTKKV